MQAIARQMLVTATLCLGMYVAVLLLSFVVEPDNGQAGWLDVWTAEDSLYMTGPKYAFLARDVLNVAEPKLLVLGASNAGAGLRQKDLQALVPCAKVSNVALGGANISEVAEMIELIHSVQSESARQTNTYVIGVWYGMFVDSKQNWATHPGETDLDVERYRYGFDRRSDTGPVSVVPARWLHLGVTIIRPYLLLEKVLRHAFGAVRPGIFEKPVGLADGAADQQVISDSRKHDSVDLWRKVMGPDPVISADQVLQLRKLIDDLLNAGHQVVLVDLPVPPWFLNVSPWEAPYLKSLGDIAEAFNGRPGFHVVETQDLGTDDGFVDEVHPKPRLAHVLAARLADFLDLPTCSARSASAP